jgi:hypothetical protein
MAFKMKGWSPFTANGESWWTRTKRQFSSKNKYGFGDARGRDKSASKAQIKHQMNNPRKRGEAYADYQKRIGKPSGKKVFDARGLLGSGESAQK